MHLGNLALSMRRARPSHLIRIFFVVLSMDGVLASSRTLVMRTNRSKGRWRFSLKVLWWNDSSSRNWSFRWRILRAAREVHKLCTSWFLHLCATRKCFRSSTRLASISHAFFNFFVCTRTLGDETTCEHLKWFVIFRGSPSNNMSVLEWNEKFVETSLFSLLVKSHFLATEPKRDTKFCNILAECVHSAIVGATQIFAMMDARSTF